MSSLCAWIFLLLLLSSPSFGQITEREADIFHKSDHRNAPVRPQNVSAYMLPPDVCAGPPLTGVEWVLSQKDSNYGWGEQSHRAIIVLELNNYGSSVGRRKEILLMQQQLELELSKALLRNSTQSPMQMTELALYIQALLAMGSNPREFYGVDLVDLLLSKVDAEVSPHPFAILVLCSARAVQNFHLHRIRSKLHLVKPTSRNKENAALALKTFACAREQNSTEFRAVNGELDRTAEALARLQKEDGSFGDVYSTALIVQALKVYNYREHWDDYRARNFLRAKQGENVNMLSTYYIEMALHPFEGLFTGKVSIEPRTVDGMPSLSELQRWPAQFYVQYTLRVGERPNVYSSITIKIPSNVTFFDVMRLAANENPMFNFSYHINKKKEPVVYSICGIPNDAENSRYWRLVLEQDVDHNRHVSTLREMKASPKNIYPKKDSHWIYWHYDVAEEIQGVLK